MKPTLETLAGLYAAALEQREGADLALQHVRESAVKHGYTEEQIKAETEKERAHRLKK